LFAAFDIDDEAALMLSREGLNSIAKGPAGRARLRGSVTLGRGSESHRKFASLPVRRLCLRMISAIEQATRWAVFASDNSHLAKRIRSQVFAYLSCLADMDAFENDRFAVECDAGLRNRDDSFEHGVTILIVFHPAGCKESVSFTLHQTIAGCRVTTTAFAPVMEDCT
jgi:phage tail sheath protein FI